MESTDLSVPPHLQDLFDKSVTQGDLAPSHQCSLAALMRRHSDALATGPMDLGFAMYWSMTSTPVTPNQSDNLHVVHLSLLVKQKKKIS